MHCPLLILSVGLLGTTVLVLSSIRVNALACFNSRVGRHTLNAEERSRPLFSSIKPNYSLVQSKHNSRNDLREKPVFPLPLKRNEFLRRCLTYTPAFLCGFGNTKSAGAAPPFAIMAEEMGYFPVTDERTGQTVMVPAKAKRESTEQAINLAKYLRSTGSKMYGAFWCPHCQRQKELFGREAWKYVDYVECSPKGYRSQFSTCIEQGVDGYPFWKFGNGEAMGGEMELVDIAKLSGFLKAKGANSFNKNLESDVPPLGGKSCQ